MQLFEGSNNVDKDVEKNQQSEVSVCVQMKREKVCGIRTDIRISPQWKHTHTHTVKHLH